MINTTKYSAYKSSGVEWLGEIPEHWECTRMKHLFRDYSEKNKPNAELLSVTQNQGVIPRTWVENRMVMPSGALESFKFIQKGDFAISLRSFEGGLEYCNHDGIISPAYTVLKAKRNFYSPFYKYLFKSFSFISTLQTSVVGIRQGKNISYPELSYSFLPVPPLPEQTTIANFLDRKTKLINKAIGIKEKQIELLNERRQILIHRAVTRGLNPDVKLKDSGVEWIGEIPEHWKVKRLKFIFDLIQTGTTPSTLNPNFFDGDLNWYNPKDLNDEFLREAERKISQLALQRKEIKLFPNDSILIVGIGGTTGKTSYMLKEATFNQQITGFHSNKNINEYYFYTMRSMATVMLNTANYTTLPILNNEFFKSFVLIEPTTSEQKVIVDYSNELSIKIATAISLKEKEIEKLKEYKATLINSAVTGKINVSE